MRTEHRYRTKGTCASEISFELEDGKVYNIGFRNGCNGNLKAISKLCEGKDAREISELLRGNTCGYKSTSCADQLAIALDEALKESEANNG